MIEIDDARAKGEMLRSRCCRCDEGRVDGELDLSLSSQSWIGCFADPSPLRLSSSLLPALSSPFGPTMR
jgi:hypothetical protein